ncbi:MAG TPA: arsenic resistance N-acetyltransferase ArsN2 [Stellaceae bacterium]|nr:arsenic resistance N-acetyltransferase ArsN2 [Stellaceae bacterium]
MTPHPIDERQKRDLIEMLAAEQLPTDDLADTAAEFFVFHDPQGARTGFAGLEMLGEVALLRSVVIMPGSRGRGHGAAIVREMIAVAAKRGVKELFILTTTAAPFFAKLGFRPIERRQAPPSIASTPEFASLCPASAIVMRRSTA